MARKTILIPTLLGALALQGLSWAQPMSSGPAPQDDPAQWSDSQKAAYNAGFDRDTHDSCLSAAQSHGVAAAAADRYCSCIVDRLRPLSIEIKTSLAQHPDAMNEAAASCKAQMNG